MSKKGFIIIALFLTLVPYAEAWETVSLPNQTVLIKEEEIIYNRQEKKIIYCRSSLSKKDIEAFYMRFLPGLGWKDNCPECKAQDSNAPLKFIKAESEIVIVINPSSLDKNKNEVIIVMSQIQEDNALSKEMGENGQDLPGEDASGIPRYPQSKRVTSVIKEAGRKMLLSYRTLDSKEEVLNFYRKNMSEYGWDLIKEVDFNDLPAQVTKIKENIELKGKALIFKGVNGRCVITVSEHFFENSSVIGVNYNAQ